MRGDEPAYPFVCSDVSKHQVSESGLTVREMFAMAAMTSWANSSEAQRQLADAVSVYTDPKKRIALTHAIMAKRAFALADAMLAELEKKK